MRLLLLVKIFFQSLNTVTKLRNIESNLKFTKSLNGYQLSRRGAAKTAVASPKKSKSKATKRTASPSVEPEPSTSPTKKAKRADKATDPPASTAAPTRDVVLLIIMSTYPEEMLLK